MERIARPAARVWSLADDRAGNRRQADALARALAIGTAESKTLAPRAPWRWLAPRRLPGSTQAFGAGFADALAHPPTLAIGCGRQAALATRLLRAHGARSVQVLDPRLAPDLWDLVVVPEHDRVRGPNVLTALGSLNPVDEPWLAEARTAFPAFALLPRPRIALLLGGSSRHFDFDLTRFDALADALEHLLVHTGGSLLATVSRRTPPAIVAHLPPRFGHVPGVAWTGGDAPNPYAGLLAWADRIVCTPDSVNMLSEACATRAPVQVFAPHAVGGRVRYFLERLQALDRVRPLGTLWHEGEAEPLRETARIAAEVRARLRLDAVMDAAR
ncbi:MAG: nucleoside-diphosphate sugar epimerase [Lysobacter sp.]|nr:nucleoside-diphosphate sugar epimerase [Lysobacter sp.]